jgi:hypothetical protein
MAPPGPRDSALPARSRPRFDPQSDSALLRGLRIMGKDTIDEKLDKGIKAAKSKDMAFAIVIKGSDGAVGIANDESAAKKLATDAGKALGISGPSPSTGIVRWDSGESKYKFESADADTKMSQVLKAVLERDLGRKVAFTCLPPTPTNQSPLPIPQSGNGQSVNPQAVNPRTTGAQATIDPKTLDPEMQNRLAAEQKKYVERTYPGREVWDRKIATVESMPAEKQDAGYAIVGKQILQTINKLKSDDSVDPQTADAKHSMLTTLYQEVSQARNQAQRGPELAAAENKAQKPIETYDENKNTAARREVLLKELERLKPDMKKAEASPNNPQTATPKAEFEAARKGLLLSLKRGDNDMAELNLEKLKKATAVVIGIGGLAIEQAKSQLATAKSLQTMSGNLKSDPKGTFPANESKEISKETDRGLLKGGHGAPFKAVLKALGDVEKTPSEPQLTTLENAAKAYLADYEKRLKEAKDKPNDLEKLQTDPITQTKVETCKDCLEKVRKLRVRAEIEAELNKLPTGKWSPEQLAQGNRLKAQMIAESGGSKPLGDDDGKGASESYFLKEPGAKDATFIFKPSDGEHNAGYGWQDGGGAPREVALSAVSDVLRTSTGLDCGVSPTTLVKINNPSVGVNKKGDDPARTGAIQNIVNADPDLSAKFDPAKPGYDPKFINQVPPAEIEKVAILDFVTLQMDRQGPNLLVSKDANGNPTLTPIDAGNALPSRNAFEASRRMFNNNAVLAGDEAQKPFSKDALDKINAINVDDVLAGMKKANAEMAKVDPKAGQAIGDENMEMARRSILFLKKAAPVLSKAEIADAYANLFQLVLDAHRNTVEDVIDTVIREQLAKPSFLKEIDKIPNAQTQFAEQGWPSGEFNSLKRENPERLLKILQQKRQCPTALAEIQNLLKVVPAEKSKTILASTTSLSGQLKALRLSAHEADDARLLADPEAAKQMKKLGWDFTVTSGGETRNLTLADDKAKILRQMQAYAAAGGDDALKKRKLDPAKLTQTEKIFEGLGGEAAHQRLVAEGLTDYDGDKLTVKISDLESAEEYKALGGNEVYAKLGGPQSKEASLPTRIGLIKDKKMAQTAAAAGLGGAEQVLEALTDLLDIINDTKAKCTDAEAFFVKKRPQIAKFDAEANKPLSNEAQAVRVKELETADSEIGDVMKKFGKWNGGVMAPWKQIQGQIATEKLDSEKRVKQLNRQVTQAYDAYVVELSAAQDLGQDYLDMLRRAKKKTQGEKGTLDTAIAEIKKLDEQMNAENLGAASKVNLQLAAVKEIDEEIKTSSGKIDTFSEQQWDAFGEWETKARQAAEIAKANYRATQRGKETARDYLKQWANNDAIQKAVLPVVQKIAHAEKNFDELEKLLPALLQDIAKLEEKRPVLV